MSITTVWASGRGAAHEVKIRPNAMTTKTKRGDGEAGRP
jgi:hypothetical protein